VHGKIFGGYIMKKAFEIAHVAAVGSFYAFRR
jgi:acyl-CoA hydrolase